MKPASMVEARHSRPIHSRSTTFGVAERTIWIVSEGGVVKPRRMATISWLVLSMRSCACGPALDVVGQDQLEREMLE